MLSIKLAKNSILDKVGFAKVGDVSETKYLPCCPVRILSLGAFQKQLHIGVKLVRSGNVSAIGIIICSKLAEKYDWGTIAIAIW